MKVLDKRLFILADWRREHTEEWTDPTPYWSASGKVIECEIDATQ